MFLAQPSRAIFKHFPDVLYMHLFITKVGSHYALCLSDSAYKVLILLVHYSRSFCQQGVGSLFALHVDS
jgi:hypothetical protein